MFERFTDRARRVVILAQEDARARKHEAICTEHLLVGLAAEGEGVGAIALKRLGLTPGVVLLAVEDARPEGPFESHGVHLPFTPRAKKVLELSLREALQLGHNYVGTEHILLGLIREGEGLGAKILVEHGASLTDVRQSVIRLLSSYAATEPFVKFGLPRGSAREALNWLDRWIATNGPLGDGHPVKLVADCLRTAFAE